MRMSLVVDLSSVWREEYFRIYGNIDKLCRKLNIIYNINTKFQYSQYKVTLIFIDAKGDVFKIIREYHSDEYYATREAIRMGVRYLCLENHIR
jgi:hypothetical protein